jgi:hypothetical protein
MAEEKREFRIVSLTPGFTQPHYDTPELGSLLNHLPVDERSCDHRQFLDDKLAPGTTINSNVGMILGWPDPFGYITPHSHDVDEGLYFISMREDWNLGCEVHFDIEGKTYVFTHTTQVFLPAGCVHGPLIWKNFDNTRPHPQSLITHALLSDKYI